MGFFTKDKPIDCYKKVNKMVKKMYYLKKTLILKANTINDNDRESLLSDLNDIISCYNCIVHMDFDGQYLMMQRDVWYGSSVIDYECKSLSIKELMDKVYNEIAVIKRITKGAPIVMSEVNPNSLPNDFFYDEHKLGVSHSMHINSPLYELPPMFYV